MLVICVRRKYVTLIYDTTQAGGGVYPGWWGDGLPEEEVYKFCLK